MTQGIDQYTIRDDFSRFGDIEDCFVPMDREVPGKLRGFAFVTYRDAEAATDAVRDMHGRNYHGREITVNVAKPRGPDPKKEGGHLHQGGQGSYSGKYDAGGRLRPEYRGTEERSARYDRDDGRSDGERERDYGAMRTHTATLTMAQAAMATVTGGLSRRTTTDEGGIRQAGRPAPARRQAGRGSLALRADSVAGLARGKQERMHAHR